MEKPKKKTTTRKKRRSKKKVSKVQAVEVEKAEKPKNMVSFKAFFARCVALRKVTPWQEKQLQAFFKSKDLKNKEDLDTYQKMLEKF